MRQHAKRGALRREDGSVAIEAALTISLILIPLLAFMLFFGRYFWYYTVAQKAVHDATLYFAAAPLPDIRNTNAADLAQDMIDAGLVDIDDDTLSMTGADTFCMYRTVANPDVLTPRHCNATTPPAAVKAQIGMTVNDPFLSSVTGSILGYEGLFITAEATLPYVGR